MSWLPIVSQQHVMVWVDSRVICVASEGASGHPSSESSIVFRHCFVYLSVPRFDFVALQSVVRTSITNSSTNYFIQRPKRSWQGPLYTLVAAKREERQKTDRLRNVPRRLVLFNGVWHDVTTTKHRASNTLMLGMYAPIISRTK